MRVSERHQRISVAKTNLVLEIFEYMSAREVDDLESLRLVTLEMRDILLDMKPKIERADRFSDLKDMIRQYQEANEMTDIETTMALHDYCSSVLNGMLRYERHGNYDTPAGLEK